MIAVLGVQFGGLEKILHKNYYSEIYETEHIMQATAGTKDNKEEMRAVWISYLEFQNANVSKMSQKQFETYIDNMFSNCKELNMNTVIVQVRPFGDALYKSKIFPWSSIISGKQGKNPGFDPLRYMVKAAHQKGLKFHAWLNPYRVTLANMKAASLSSNNPAVKWRKTKGKKRNVLSFDGAWYYNPSKKDVQKLIVDGVKEIVENYPVDGIHFDDYFYPTLGPSYKKNFDAAEYKKYKSSHGKKAVSIVQWRRNNVNQLVKQVYAAVKTVDKELEFGISPAGNINNLYAPDRYYSDVKKWMASKGYIDYICPQIYWSHEHKICPYKQTVNQWASLKKDKSVDLYIGIAAYRAGINKKEAKGIGDLGWAKGKKELKKQVLTGRTYKNVEGFVFYRYDNLVSKKTKKEISNLKKVLK